MTSPQSFTPLYTCTCTSRSKICTLEAKFHDYSAEWLSQTCINICAPEACSKVSYLSAMYISENIVTYGYQCIHSEWKECRMECRNDTAGEYEKTCQWSVNSEVMKTNRTEQTRCTTTLMVYALAKDSCPTVNKLNECLLCKHPVQQIKTIQCHSTSRNIHSLPKPTHDW